MSKVEISREYLEGLLQQNAALARRLEEQAKLIEAQAKQYGRNIAALAVTLGTVGMMSYERTRDVLHSVFSVPISTGTISAFVCRCAQAVNSQIQQIRQQIRRLPVCHFDETGFRVDGKLHWIHCASNSEYTLLSVEQKRGTVGMDSLGVIPGYTGIAVHDCWAPYFRYKTARHALCCVHLIRELIGIEENWHQSWCRQFGDLLLRMKDERDKLILAGIASFDPERRRYFDTEYDRLVYLGYDQNPKPKDTGRKKRGRPYNGYVRSFLNRLVKYKASVCLFADDFTVPFDNNQAERDIRFAKVKQKVSGCFRTKSGADIFALIMSYVATARKHSFDAFSAIRNALSGHPDCGIC